MLFETAMDLSKRPRRKQSKPVTVTADNKFSGTATLSGGTNSVDVQATDYSGNTRTSTYQVTVSGTTKSITHDANGNMTGDGTRTFEWDAENRLVAVNNGTHRSEFSYDGLSRRIRILEKENSVITTDTRFLWCGEELCEQRDSTGGTVNKRYVPQGFRDSDTNYFYATDHLGSIRELTDASANLSSRFDYDPYGRRTQLSGATMNADVGFT